MAATLMQTPQKPLPGAYLQTPAPKRNPQSASIFRTSSVPKVTGDSQPSVAQSRVQQYPDLPVANAPQPQPQPQVGEKMTNIERAAQTVNRTLEKESRFPQMDSYILQGHSSDYEIPTQPWAPFQRVRMFELPDQIFEQYNRAQVNTMMGLFAEINHAWVSIDNALYLWDYTHPNPSLLGFEEQPNSITAVKMVRPRPGVFVSSITRLLVVATTTDIFLIGVAVQTNADGARSVSLYQTNMQVSIKGISVHVIAGSDRSGRIFFAGRADDDIYELTYQQEEKWFSSRCNKVNHSRKGLDSVIPSLPFSQKSPHGSIIQLAVDDTRDIVYSLTSRSTLKAFHMRTIAVFEHCITRTQSGIMADVRHRVSTTPMLPNDTSIVSVAPIPATEGGRFSLVATTSTGCRLYFSSVHGSYYSSETRGAMSSIQVYHIRFPPADSPTTVAPQPAPQNQAITYPGQPLPPPSSSLTQTRTSERYPPGFFLCFHQKSADAANDSLFMSAPEPGRVAYRQEQGQGQTFQESGQWVGLGGRMEDIGLVTPAGLASSEPLGFGNEMAVQYDQPVCEIAVLTNSGVSTFRRRRLVDVFAAAIRSGGGDDGLAGAIRNFNRNYGRGETVATAIAVICGQASDVTSDSRIARITDPSVLEYARKAFIEHGGKPTLNENTVIDQRGPNIDNVSPSPRHEGLALYLSRLLRSVWRTKILTESQNEVGGIRITSTVPLTKLQDIQRSLQDVKEFLDQYKNSIEGLAGPDALTRLATRQEEIAQSGEHRALQSLYQLISHVIEGLAFVLVLFDEHVNETVFGLDEAERNAMRQMTFERLFCGPDGSRVAKELVKQIVNRNINLGSNVDTVTDALRRKCGSFCSAEDCTIFKAQEEINKATEIDATSESSRHLLNQSLLHLQHVASCLPMEQFKWAVDSYVANEFYAGAIELALKVASEKDRGNRALAWYNEGQPRQDDRALAYDARIKCYDLIHQVITAVDQVFDQSPEIVDGFYTVTAKRRREAYNVVNESKDELFQINLYDWYLSNNWSERLLDVRSDFVEKYLKRRSQDEPDFADLLWRYYAHYNSFIEAAKVQLTLAKSVFDLSLERRIEYLSFARANASTKTIGISEVGRTRQSRQELMREVSDLMDIANLQSDVLDRIKSEPRLSGERRAKVIADLDGRVKTIDELYNGYTDQADYHDLSLLIYSIADHRNAGDIRATWSNLIEAAHDKAMRSQSAYDGPSPYEVIPEVVQTMGTKLQLSETFFPMATILPLLKSYPAIHSDDLPPPPHPNWATSLLLDNLSVPHQSLLTTLETLLYSDDFTTTHQQNQQQAAHNTSSRSTRKGKQRPAIPYTSSPSSDMLFVIRRWFEETSGMGGRGVFGGEENARGVQESLREIVEGEERGRGDLEDDELREEAVGLRRRIAALVR